MPAECLPGAHRPGDASLAAESRPGLSRPPRVCPQPRGPVGLLGPQVPLLPCPPHSPWAPAAAASWMLPDSALGRPQGPPLWDPACCCPRAVFLPGEAQSRPGPRSGTEAPSPALVGGGAEGRAAPRSWASGRCWVRWRETGTLRPQQPALCPWLEHGARRGRASRDQLGAGVAGSACRTARPSRVLSLPRFFQEGLSWPCSPPTSLERRTLFQKVLGSVLL